MNQEFISHNDINFINEFLKNLSQKTQIFYERGRNQFIIRDQYQVYLVNRNHFDKITRIKIPYDGVITSMSVHAEQKCLVYQIAPDWISIFSSRLNKQSSIRMPKAEQNIIQFEWIYSMKGYVDFLIIEGNGVHLFKIDEEKNSSLREVKIFQTKVSACWFDPQSEVLVTTRNDVPGLMQTYFFNEKRKEYKYKGPEFYLEDFGPNSQSKSLSSILSWKTSKNEQKTSTSGFMPQCDKKNKNVFIEKEQDQPHRIDVVTLYGKCYLLHTNSFLGKIILYSLLYDKVEKQLFAITFPSDVMVNISIVDNLIVLSAIPEKISQVFDIKKIKPEVPLGAPQPIKRNYREKIKIQSTPKKQDSQSIQPQRIESQLVEEEQKYEQTQSILLGEIEQTPKVENQFQNIQQNEKQIEAQYQGGEKEQQNQEQIQMKQESLKPVINEIQIGYDFDSLFEEIRESDREQKIRDNFTIQSRWSVVPQEEVQDANKQDTIYNFDSNFVGDDIIVCQNQKIFKQFNLSLALLPVVLVDEIESFLCLLRRTQNKIAVFEFLKGQVAKHQQIMSFSFIFKHIFEILLRALKERTIRNENQIDLPNDKVSERLRNGYLILYPSDMQVDFFQALAEDPKINKTYLTQLIVEFIRQFIEIMKKHNLTIPYGIQNLLIKILVRENRLSYVHFLLQYMILNDSVDFAQLLIDISSEEELQNKKIASKYKVYQPAFQLGIDMLYRLGRVDEMLDIFSKRGQFNEVVHLLKKHPIVDKIKIQSIIVGVNRPDCEFTKNEIYNYFDDIMKRHKNEKFSFTQEELKSLLLI